MPLVKAYVAPNFLRKQNYKQITNMLPARANWATCSLVRYRYKRPRRIY